MLRRRLRGRQLKRHTGVCALADEGIAPALEALQGSRVTGTARGCDPRVEPVEPALEVGDRDVLREDRPQLREAGDRLLEVRDGDAEREP